MGFKMYPKNGHAMENNPHTRSRDESTFKISSAPDFIPKTEKELKLSTKEERFYKNSALILDSSSQVYSGLDDNSTEPHESLTESSNVTFVDSYTLEESVDNHSLNEVGMIYLKEFVLIDDDEDGDMSLREKTVTDFSVRDGKAADLVCGRLLSTSTGFDCKDESSFHGPTSPEEVRAEHKKNCCFCTLL
ncbi:PREDICTED: paralemmin-2-like [Cyprinodon variegatus]|uniref:paralemmin-2-like n=1 Tax=Cyprinodon variegatus TaxID=28743 RepID=UPI000742B31A|nr:PREDICTED: paralemmin-2-like [Cyprinodon variegatus]